MRRGRSQQVHRRQAAPSVALQEGAPWPEMAEAGSDPFDLRSTDRLAWPTAIAVIIVLSAGLWAGIGVIVSLTLG
ncbi:MAG: hypothetical protein MUC89_15375 [Acetobacteraceae bacterium]|nr:hypothetical protein [Acetobacteraceae bacterium]